MWARVKLGLGALAVTLLVVFFLQNLQEVDIHFLWFDWTTRMLYALVIAAIVGALAAAVFATTRPRDVA
jgi:uncharacterized integral membrane protein